MKLHYIHRADEKCCPRRALSLYQSQPDTVKQVHECPSALSHPDAAKDIKKNPELFKSLKKVYDRDKLHKEGDWSTKNWWTGEYSLLAGFFLSEENAREAIKVYVERRNKSNEEARQDERKNRPDRYSEEELSRIYPFYKEGDFEVGSINIPDSKKSCKIRKIEPKRHCGNCRFRIVEHDLDRREPMGCLYHLDESFYEPMAQVCDRWASCGR